MPPKLGATVLREVLARAEVAPDAVGHIVFGHFINTEPQDMYLSRVAAMKGGVPAMTMTCLSGSGLQAVISAAQTIAPAAVRASRWRSRRAGTTTAPHAAMSALQRRCARLL